MHLSANQIRTTALKACVGAGVCRGVAEDIADGCVTLVRSGIDPTCALISVLNEFDLERPSTTWVDSDDQAHALNTFVLSDGSSMVDLVQTDKNVVGSTDNMLLLLGLMLTRSSEFEIAIAIDDRILSVENIQAIAAQYDAEPARQFKLKLAAINRFVAPVWKTPELPSPENWAKLNKLSEAILVPADAESRADAGAGSTDND